ncbi:MAG TPA: 3-hydroxyacyl-CoA dehydrogenase NAD-binding domain-containing protein, partial [Flavisolibacter sp.]|nr:3-hydroxyacyl-CoA dehydrogenase NAD-binding domain-containing protein [Flavisolibacter sp.]
IIIMKKVCICGAGTMGSGIAQVAASAGFPAILYDINPKGLQIAKERIEKDLGKLVVRGKLDAEKRNEIEDNITYTSYLSGCVADIIIEAVVENIEVKVSLFNQLAAINPVETILASNTSSLSISEIAAKVTMPERVIGVHFFNPAPLMKLVEVIKGSHTSTAVVDKILNFTKALNKVPVLCKDSPGFIVNRVARPYYIEALRLAEEGVPFETIDKVLEAQGFKLGPFKLMDLIGNDVNYAVSCSVYNQLNKPERLKPSYIQKEKVETGQLGKKSGKGYYNY